MKEESKNIFLEQSLEKKTLKVLILHHITGCFTKVFPNLSYKLFLKIFCNPKSRRDYDLKTDLDPKVFKIKTQIGKVNLYKFGNGSKHILLNHGWADSTRRFTHLINYLFKENNDYTIWSLDHIGHGKSEGNVAHLFGFIDGLSLSIKFIIESGFEINTYISHSMGGLALLNVKDEYLINTRKIIISSPAKFFEFMFKRTSSMGISPLSVENLLNKISKMYNKNWQMLSADKNIHKIDSSFLFIHDEDDDVCFIKNVRDLLANTPHKFYTTKKLGHLKILKNTEVFDQIAGFIRT